MLIIGSVSEKKPQCGLLVRLLQRASPIRRIPIWARFLLTSALVFGCFEVRVLLDDVYPYPFLVFLPAVVLASFVFDRGSGLFATVLSGMLAFYFFIEPRSSMVVGTFGAVVSLLLYMLVGALIATIIEALRLSLEELTVINEALNKRTSELADSFNRFETVVESASDPIYLKDREGRYVHLNAAASAMLGAPKSAIIGQGDSDFLPEEQAAQILRTDRQVLEKHTPVTAEELRLVHGRGERWYLATRSPWYGPDGKLVGIVGIARDIHDRKVSEDILRSSEEQKSILLTDMAHRVMNHLQSIIAFLSLSLRSGGGERGAEVLQATMGRIMALARVYDRFRVGEEATGVVDARDYLQSLLQDIATAILGDRPIRVEIEVAEAEIELDRAVTVGLIVNEAVTNALKHAFPGDRVGTVSVRLADRGETFVLEIADDGVGLPEKPAADRIGQWLLGAMARQLQGTLTVSGLPGAVITVEFPKRSRPLSPG